jgi:hypothetical protein
LSAVVVMLLAIGAVPVVQGLVPSDVAVFPGTMVIVQLLPAASVEPQLVKDVVPLGQVGGEKKRFTAGAVPVLVTVMTLGTPELGVPLTPYSVSPVTLSAKLLTLDESVVVFVVHARPMFVTFALPTAPEPLLTEHVWPAG